MHIDTIDLISELRFNSDTTLTALSPQGMLYRFESNKQVAAHTVGRPGMEGRLNENGSLAAIWHGETKIEVFSTTDAKKITETPQLTGTVCGIAFSPDRTQLIYSTTDATLHCWSLSSNKMNWRIRPGIGEVVGLRFSPDGTHFFATNMDTNIRVHAAANAEIESINEQLPISLFECFYTPDGKLIAAAGAARQVHIFAAKGLKIERKFRREADPIDKLSLSKDGKLLAAGLFQELSHRNPTYLVIYDFATGEVIKEITTRSSPMGLTLAPSARKIAWSLAPSGIEIADF